MTSRTTQASPDALDGFAVTTRRRADHLGSTLADNRARVLAPKGKLDNFGVIDQLSAGYPAARTEALDAVTRLAEVLQELAAATRKSAAAFREADRPAQGPG